jgi:hypothetical protein
MPSELELDLFFGGESSSRAVPSDDRLDRLAERGFLGGEWFSVSLAMLGISQLLSVLLLLPIHEGASSVICCSRSFRLNVTARTAWCRKYRTFRVSLPHCLSVTSSRG